MAAQSLLCSASGTVSGGKFPALQTVKRLIVYKQQLPTCTDRRIRIIVVCVCVCVCVCADLYWAHASCTNVWTAG